MYKGIRLRHVNVPKRQKHCLIQTFKKEKQILRKIACEMKLCDTNYLRVKWGGTDKNELSDCNSQYDYIFNNS